MPKQKKITPELKEQVLNLRKQGYTYLEIGKITDSSAHMVVEICRGTTKSGLTTKGGMTNLWIQWDNLHARYKTC